MTEDFDIREYRPGDEVGILPSFNRVFREVCGPTYVDRDMAFWRWQFEQNPHGHRITVAVANDGTIAAHYGGVPLRLHTRYGDAIFVHIVDSFVVPEYRAGLKRPGLFVVTAYPWFELCHRMGDAVMYGYPVKTAERIGQRYLEYHLLRVVDYLCRDAASGTTTIPAGVELERVQAVPAALDQLFAEVAARRECLIRRDHAYLDWRYVQRPGDDYLMFTATRGGRLRGFLVLRPVHELVPGACTIVDWVVPDGDEEVVDALLACATSTARERGRQTVMAVFAQPSPEYAALLARGFEVVPSGRYDERRLTHRIYHPEMTTEWLTEHWWYTLGDSDLA